MGMESKVSRCPFCEEILKRHFIKDLSTLGIFKTCLRCCLCDCIFPIRYEDPNLALTWDEVREACDTPGCVILWQEWRSGHIKQVFPAYVSNKGEAVFETPDEEVELYYQKSEYGKRFRCWIRKPTMNEMENMPWEEKQK